MGLELQSNISTQEMLNRSRAILEKLGLGNKLNYYLARLSGVQKEWVAIKLKISQSAENCLPWVSYYPLVGTINTEISTVPSLLPFPVLT